MQWTVDETNHLIELYKQHGKKWTFIAELMTKKFNKTYTESMCRNRINRIAKKAENLKSLSFQENQIDDEEWEILSDGSYRSKKLIWLNSKQDKNPEVLLKAHGFDPKEWQLISSKNKMWNVYSKIDKTQVQYSSTINVKPKVKEITLDDVKEIVQDVMQNYKAPIYQPIRYADSGKMLEVNISDLHLNKLGYKDGEYDHKKAEEVFFYILNDVLTRTENMRFEKILFIWSHDFFNIDNLAKATTYGTPQDVSIRFADMYKQGKRMLIQAIDLLRQFAPVETVQVGANHDRLTSYTLSEVLDAWFKDDPNVVIDTDPLSRKYRRFGKCLIGFSHGDKEKKRLGKIMPVEARREWGKTLFAEIHAAHLHSEQAVKEENGVIVRYLSSPSGIDNWHFENGYVGAVRKVQHFIWDRENGLEHILHTTIVPDPKELGTVYCL